MNKDHAFYLEILKAVETRSTCAKMKVGAVIFRDGRIISTGWNGGPSGVSHCEDKYKNHNRDEKFLKSHSKFSEKIEIHAECNAITFTARNGINTNNSVIVVSYSPCMSCAKLIVSAGIEVVLYIMEYNNQHKPLMGVDNAVNFFKLSGVKISKIKR